MKRILLVLIICSQSLYADVVLNFSNSNNQPERKAVIRYLLDAFELYNSDIKVNLIAYDENDTIDSILGMEPNIIMAESRLLHRMNSRDVLDTPLTEKMTTTMQKSNFYTGGINTLSENGELIALPYSAWLQVIWYKKSWFENSGIKAPDTMENIVKAAKYFTLKDSGNYGLITGRSNEVYLQQCFLQLAEPSGFKLRTNADGSPYIKKADAVKALDYYSSLMEYTPQAEINWRARDYFFQNKASMLIYSTHLMDDIAIPEIAKNSLGSENFSELEGDKYSDYLLKETGMITSIKGEADTTSFGSISGLGLIKSDDPEILEAQKKLVEFLYREDVYITWLHMSPGGMLPVYKKILENDNFYRDPAGVFKRYGRDRIIELTNGIEYLTLLDTESLSEDGIQNMVYNWAIKGDRNIDNISWIQ